MTPSSKPERNSAMIAARSKAASGGGTCSSRKRYHVRYGSVMATPCASAVNLATACCQIRTYGRKLLTMTSSSPSASM
jgi:hypothetical protein